jgi:integrase/recombinase XerD
MNSEEKSLEWIKPTLTDNPHFKESQISKIIPIFLASYSSENTRLAYEKSIYEFLDFWEKKEIFLSRVSDLQRFHLDAWQRFMETSSKLSKASICAKVSALVSLARFLTENGWIEKNPGEFIKLPRISKQKGKTEPFTEDEIKMILEALREDYLKAQKPSYKKEDYKAWLYYGIFLTMSAVGMRCSEFTHLKISDFEKSGSFYRLHLNLKGGMEHSPLIPQYLSDFLLLFIKNCRSFSTENDPIFVLIPQKNEAIKREYLSKIISNIAKKYNIGRKISAHSLRATVASLLHKNSVPVGEIKDLLGHKSIMTTMMYIRKTDEEKESAALKNPLGNIFKPRDNN